jgi:RNA polymerase sigma-70 factor (ECF subfamily)
VTKEGRTESDLRDTVRAALDERWRASHGRMVAALTRRFGVRNFAHVENAIQDAYGRALHHWTEHGFPDDSERWLIRVAHNAAVDALRGERGHLVLERARDVSDASEEPPPFDADDEVRLMFLCCDPSLPRAAQIALVLNVAFGLTAKQIATAFMTEERTVAQRLVRAKHRLRAKGVRFHVPSGGALPTRLGAILDVLYLVFSEGFSPSVGEEAFDGGLCAESLRFVRLLTSRPDTALPATYALRALLCFHVSRASARLADDGGLLLLQEQDRARWDAALMAEAWECLERASTGAKLTRFHIEAGIAACHAAATAYASTDWAKILELYDVLQMIAPSLIVDVNRAWAVAMSSGARSGLDELDAIPEREAVSRYPYALAAYADLHASLGEIEQALAYLDRAIQQQPAGGQSTLLNRKRSALSR